MPLGPGERDEPPAREPGAWRLTFAYRGQSVELVSRQRVAMLPPPPDEAGPGAAPRAGFWVEVRDAADASVYRKRLPNPIADEREVFSPDPAEPIRRVRVAEPEGAFQVVVPDLPAGHDVVLQGDLGPAATRGARVRELARVRLVEAPPDAQGRRAE